MLATASARVATVKAVRARRRERSVTDLRNEAESISAASVRDDDAVADRDDAVGAAGGARGRASRTRSSCPRRSAVPAGRTSRPPSPGRGCPSARRPRSTSGRPRASARSRRAAARRPKAQPGGCPACLPGQPARGCDAPARSAPLRAAPRRSRAAGRILERGERRQQLEELENDPDVGAAPDCELLLAQLVETTPIDGDRAGRRPVDAGDDVQGVDLPLPEGPTTATSSPAAIERSTPRSAGSRPSPSGRPSRRRRARSAKHAELRRGRPGVDILEHLGRHHRPPLSTPLRIAGSDAAAIGEGAER